MNDPEDIFTVGPGMTLLEAYTKAIARVAELEAENTRLQASMLGAEMKENADAILRWLEMNPNPVGLNLYALGGRLNVLAAALQPTCP